MYRKIISAILIISIVFCSMGVSAYADSSSIPQSLWKLLFLQDMDDTANGIFDSFIGSPSGCAESADGDHHFEFITNTSSDNCYHFQCAECGITYTEYANSNGSNYTNDYLTDDDLDDLYSHTSGKFPGTDAQVQGIDNLGRLIWYPNFTERIYCKSNVGGFYITTVSSSSWDILFVNDMNTSTFNGTTLTNSAYLKYTQLIVKISDLCPINGYYKFILPKAYFDFVFSDSTNLNSSTNMVVDSNSTYYPANSSISDNKYFTETYINNYFSQFSIVHQNPYFLIEPAITSDLPVNITQNVQNIYEGSNTYNNIVNTTTNQFYNPATNITINMSTYNYDYSTRTYNIVLADDNGTEVNVEYGTDNITVQIADTINNYYYGYSDCPEEPSHNHEWTPTIVNTRTCTQSGITTYTCESCGQAYTDVVPATGHIWDNGVLTPAVLDDETGEIITPAFYTFTCEICGETETSEAATPPSSGITETNDLWWERLLQWLEDFKNSLFNKLDNLGSSDDDAIDIEIEGDEFTFNDGENSFSFKDDFLAKFGIFGDLWEVGQYVVNIVSQDAAYAYDFDINEALSIEGGTP